MTTSKYYRQHQLPVVVVLHDPDTDEATWEAVRPDTVTGTGAGWKLVVPYRQVLNATTGTAWARGRGGRRTREPPTTLVSEINPINGSLAKIHDIFGMAEDELFVAEPFLSLGFFALLDILASMLRVRIVTSEAAIDQPLTEGCQKQSNLEIRVAVGLGARFLLVDRTTVCITAVNFSVIPVTSI